MKKNRILAALILAFTVSPALSQMQVSNSVELPARYFQLLVSGSDRVEKILDAHPDATLAQLEDRPHGHFPHAILLPAVLYAKAHPSNKHFGDPKMLARALRIGDLLESEYVKGHYTSRGDHDWDTYMWLEAYRVLEKKLGEERRVKWQKALLEDLGKLEPLLIKYQDHPWYNAPFIVTSPNHYAIYASAILVGGIVFNKPEWTKLATSVLHRYCVEEQTSDGYWGEHSQAGPTTGYDYITMTQISVYYEYSKDPEAFKALRRSTDFHKFFTYPNGTPVESINDRNRYWDVSMWGHFGFSNFPDGRRYASFLTGFFSDGEEAGSRRNDIQSLGRIAQDALYYHEGKTEPIPQDEDNYSHAMTIPAGIRKTGPWVVTYSGIIAPQVTLNNFFLDRQGAFSIFNAKSGLIISGANSKRQPELATFTEVIGKDSIHMPVSSRFQMNDQLDKLALAYNVFFAVLEVPKPTARELKFRFLTTYKWGDAVSGFNLQLALRAGQVLETGAGKKITLGKETIDWGDAETGGLIRHNGWSLHIPAGMRFTWPVYPFNPYKDAPESDLALAIGRLSTGLKAEDQDFQFSLETE